MASFVQCCRGLRSGLGNNTKHRTFHHAVKKLQVLVSEWEALKKNKGQRSETQGQNTAA